MRCAFQHELSIAYLSTHILLLALTDVLYFHVMLTIQACTYLAPYVFTADIAPKNVAQSPK